MGRAGVVPELVLLIDADAASRRAVRQVLVRQGFDVVHAGSGVVGLELIRRLPTSFRFVLVDLELPGLPGSTVVETLAHFRPDLPVLCLGETQLAGAVAAVSGCLGKPVREDAFAAQVRALLVDGARPWTFGEGSAPEALARARERYAVSGDLVEAAYELARG